jgi:large subunit ribosomal protein L17
VDYNEIYGNGIGEAETAAKKTRRAGRTKKAAAPKVEETAEVAPAAAEEKGGDDLTKIEGVGPKVAEVLHEAGITSFAKLAESKAEDIKEILEKSGGHFNAQDPTSWPEQSQLAADGKWDELKELQDKLIAGR